MKKKSLQQRVQDSLKQGEDNLNFLAKEIQKSSQIEVSLGSLFSPLLKEEQSCYQNFQIKHALWARENFILRRELLFIGKEDFEKRKLYLSLLESEAKTVDSLFDSWEDTVEGHRTTQTNALKVTIPMIAVIISLLSLIIALIK